MLFRSLEAVRREAAELRVTLLSDGVVPREREAEALIAAAARECVTNCVRHAGGRLVTVRVEERGGIFAVVITNDGVPPKGPVTEGGGLGALRHRIEASGGAMRVRHTPRFALELELPKAAREEASV